MLASLLSPITLDVLLTVVSDTITISNTNAFGSGSVYTHVIFVLHQYARTVVRFVAMGQLHTVTVMATAGDTPVHPFPFVTVTV